MTEQSWKSSFPLGSVDIMESFQTHLQGNYHDCDGFEYLILISKDFYNFNSLFCPQCRFNLVEKKYQTLKTG